MKPRGQSDIPDAHMALLLLVLKRYQLTSVHSGGVGVPDVGPHADQRLAGRDVDELIVRGDRNTLLAVCHIGADVFAEDIEWANLAFWVEHRAGLVAEDILQ